MAGVVPKSRQNPATVRAERHGHEPVTARIRTADRKRSTDQFSRGQIPEVRFAVQGTSQNCFAIGAERDGTHPATMRQRRSDRLPRGRIPKPHGVVSAPGRHDFSIGTDGHCLDPISVQLADFGRNGRPDVLAAGHFPQEHALVVIDRHQGLAVATECEADGVGVPRWFVAGGQRWLRETTNHSTSRHIPELGYGTCADVVAIRGERLAVGIPDHSPVRSIPTDLVRMLDLSQRPESISFPKQCGLSSFFGHERLAIGTEGYNRNAVL